VIIGAPKVARLLFPPEDYLKGIEKGIIVKDSSDLDRKTMGIVLPDTDRMDADKQFDVGRVLSVGDKCEYVKKGDLVVYRRLTAYRIPNGLNPPVLWKLEEGMSIICVVDE
jgi:co-chaperonin GroES (HSP10)